MTLTHEYHHRQTHTAPDPRIASSFPTVLLYVIDTPRSANPSTFVSNMLYLCRCTCTPPYLATADLIDACSVFYRAQLPLVVCFNKVDVLSHDFAVGVMPHMTWRDVDDA